MNLSELKILHENCGGTFFEKYGYAEQFGSGRKKRAYVDKTGTVWFTYETEPGVFSVCMVLSDSPHQVSIVKNYRNKESALQFCLDREKAKTTEKNAKPRARNEVHAISDVKTSRTIAWMHELNERMKRA